MSLAILSFQRSHEILSQSTLWVLNEDLSDIQQNHHPTLGYFCDYPSWTHAAHVYLHILLVPRTNKDRITLLESGIITLTKTSSDISSISQYHDDSHRHHNPTNNKTYASSLKFQCTCSPRTSLLESKDSSLSSIVVENVTIVSSLSVDQNQVPFLGIINKDNQPHVTGILFHVDVFLSSCSQWSNSDEALDDSTIPREEQPFSSSFYPTETMSLKLDIVPILTTPSILENIHKSSSSYESIIQNPLMSDLIFSSRHVTTTLENHSTSTTIACTYQIPITNLSTTRQVLIVPAYYLSIQEIMKPGYDTGTTLLSLQLSHSNLHHQTIILTQLSLHTHESQLFVPCFDHKQGMKMKKNRNPLLFLFNRKKAQYLESWKHHITNQDDDDDDDTTTTTTTKPSSFINMFNQVKWSYVPQTTLSFPILLQPHETVSTILEISAMDSMNERTFYCPICVSGYMQGYDSYHVNIVQTMSLFSYSTTSIMATSIHTKAFLRIDMSMSESTYHVRDEITLSLTITNASVCTRNLMLFFDGNSGIKRNEQNLVIPIECSTEVEEGNETIGVASTGSIGLLPITTNLILGELREQSSIRVQLGFVALKHGVWPIPQLFLIDRTNGDLFKCSHALEVFCLFD